MMKYNMKYKKVKRYVKKCDQGKEKLKLQN